MTYRELPAPSTYEDWKSWGAMLVQQLQESGKETLVSLPTYVYDSSKERNGFPTAAKGDIIWLLEGTVRKLAVFDGSTWIRYSPEN